MIIVVMIDAETFVYHAITYGGICRQKYNVR